MSKVFIRDATPDDAAEIAAIYEHYVRHGSATFEETPPEPAKMAQRIRALQLEKYPWQVACIDGAICGYAYAGPHKARSAYRFTVENSVYIAPGHTQRGIGRILMKGIIAHCTDAGFQQMMAVIGGSENAGSIRLHAALGFEHIGTARGIGWKFGRPVDVVYMQRALGLVRAD